MPVYFCPTIATGRAVLVTDLFISYRNATDYRALVQQLAAILRAHEGTARWDYGLCRHWSSPRDAFWERQ
jgi:hypothetical protein